MSGLTEESNGAQGRNREGSPLFDPVAGMRAMADIQAEGLRAASDLLERVLAPDHEDRPGRAPSPERDYAALVDAWASLLERVAGGLAQPAQSGGVTIPVDSSTVGPPLRLVLERPEQAESVSAEIWLHNGTSAAVGPLILRSGALTGAGGEALDVRVGFEPAEVPILPPRSSRGVGISVVANGRPRPGIYRGTIQAEGAPKLWLPVEVAVEPC